MTIQSIIAILIIAGAVCFVGVAAVRRVRSFSTKRKCETECGCGNT